MSRLRLLPLALVVAVSGCGDPEPSSDEAKISDVTRNFYLQVRDERWDLACNDLSRVAQKNLAAWGAANDVDGGCGGVVEQGVIAVGDPSSADLDKLHVGDVDVDGDRATATVSADDTDAQLSYVREDGKWLIGPDSFPAAKPAATPTTSTSTTARRELQVESGFSRVGGRKTSWGVRVSNPDDESAIDVEVRVAFTGDGASATRRIGIVPAGQSALVGGETATPRKVRDLDVSATAADWTDDPPAPVPAPTSATVENTSFNVAVEARIANPTDRPLDADTPVYAVLLDRRGAIVGGIAGFPDRSIAPQADATVTLAGRGPIPDAVRAQLGLDVPRP